MTNSFIRVPPDSTGKRLQTKEYNVDAVAVQTQVFHLAGNGTPSNLQSVDVRGQANVRFAEGSPTMDAFGNLRVAEQYILGAYEYTNGPMSDLFTETTSSGGAITYVPAASEVVLSTNTSAGSKSQRITNRYHFYQPGISNHMLVTLAHGDIGKANNVRRWGMFDDHNGVFFELDGTVLNTVVRSSRSGSVVDSKTPISAWDDKLDGTGISGMTIDITKANLYWIDYAWLGVGVVRFGIVSPDGARWVVHTQQNPNANIGVYMQSGSLPVGYENVNTGVTGGTSEMRLICSAVYASCNPKYTFWRHEAGMSSVKSVTTNTPLVSIKPALTYNSKPNRVGIYPESISIYVKDGPIVLSIFDDATLTGASFVPHESALHDTSATTLVADADGAFKSWLLAPGTHTLDLSNVYELNDEGYHTLADSSDSYLFTLAASKLETTANVLATVNYRELR